MMSVFDVFKTRHCDAKFVVNYDMHFSSCRRVELE